MIHTINLEMVEEDKQNRKNEWMKKHSSKSTLMSNNILPLNPDIGRYINVNGFDISEDFFKEEFTEIQKAYFSFINKLNKHYHEDCKTKN